MTKRNGLDDAIAHLESMQPNGGNTMPPPPGFNLVPLHEAGIYFARTARDHQELRLARGRIEWRDGSPHWLGAESETPTDFAARRRWYNRARWLMHDASKAGVEAFENMAQASANSGYVRESMELHYWKHPDIDRPDDFRFTVRWKKIVDDVMGDCWESPSGVIRVSVADCPTMPDPQPLPPRLTEPETPRDTVYRKLRRR